MRTLSELRAIKDTLLWVVRILSQMITLVINERKGCVIEGLLII